MNYTSNRRDFLKRIIKGTIVSGFLFSILKSEKTFALFSKTPLQNKPLPRINPAYKVNAFKDGTVELYTHTANGEKISASFSELEADILLQIVHQNNPKEFDEALANKYSLTKEEYLNNVSGILANLEKKGYLYYGELMLVKVNKDNGK